MFIGQRAHNPAIKSAAGTTTLRPVSTPLYRRPNGHPLGGVLFQEQHCTDNRLAYYGRSSRTLPGSHSTASPSQARGIASEKATGLAAVSGGVGWEPPRSGDKLQFFRTSPKPTFKKALLEAFPWTVPSSPPPLSDILRRTGRRRGRPVGEP